MIFEPFVGLGMLKFGMEKAEVESLLENISGVGDCIFEDGKLSAFSIYPDDADSLIISGDEILKMDRLTAALNLAYQSGDYGQAQGGSLYFMDLGCAILQFESPSREFFLFSQGYDTGEPLMEMSPDTIEAYYEENNWDD
ncbi:hypothetical protein [Pleionea mediterranea]|uniref:Uncharacterized protein n=1 Tax=Pleionea mediterranea TaxID=523701 RepID=A0A316FWH2_9GAMM|nr:hypothetical protein [Pleionea mediterranea]PWK53041.1 hypothetical protein C8D97_104259 [Pleionea mediterranea]